MFDEIVKPKFSEFFFHPCDLAQKKDESQDKEENTLIFYIAPLEISYAIQQFKISFGL